LIPGKQRDFPSHHRKQLVQGPTWRPRAFCPPVGIQSCEEATTSFYSCFNLQLRWFTTQQVFTVAAF
jgi:hypothetical protein